jgi:hypothetical protein
MRDPAIGDHRLDHQHHCHKVNAAKRGELVETESWRISTLLKKISFELSQKIRSESLIK